MGSFPPKTVLLSVLLLVVSMLAASDAQNCSSYRFSNGVSYRSCNALPVLDSFLHWNYHSSNRTADIAYRHTRVNSTNWVAWALNPTGTGMLDAQSLVAFVNSSGAITAYTAPVTSYRTRLEQGALSFPVSNLRAEFARDEGQMIVYATITLPPGSSTSFAHVWQHGDVAGGSPQSHPPNGDHIRSSGRIDFATGAAAAAPPAGSATPPPAPTTTTTTTGNCEYSFPNGRAFQRCNALPVLNAFLHWNYRDGNRSVDIAYRHGAVTRANWVAWALNPTGTGMLGAQSLVAYVNSSGAVRAYTSPITGYRTTLEEGPLSFPVPAISAEFVGDDQIIIYATLELPAGAATGFNQVWQHGDVAGDVLQQHALAADNRRSVGSIDFATGATSGGGGGGSQQRKRNVHGVLNVVSWGILMPMGAMAARYLKVFKSANPAWFYVHVSCQTSAYIVGVAGWATGIKLGSDSAGIQHDVHRNIGITLFALGTLQVFALLLRPKPDHKYRLYWNIYHQGVGYAVIALSIANIFEGLDILDPEKKWKNAYIGVLISLGACAALLEAFTWYVVLKRKKESNKQPHHPTNGNGYHA